MIGMAIIATIALITVAINKFGMAAIKNSGEIKK